jgi:peptide/nickel transport system substrate-binding protein
VSFYKEEWGNSFAEYDPARANRLLDEIGLTEKNRDGFRLLSDGNLLQLTIVYWLPNTEELELVKEFWEAVGVKTEIKYQEPPLWREKRFDPERTVVAHSMVDSDEISHYNGPGIYRPDRPNLGWAIPWDSWLTANDAVQAGTQTLSDFEGGKLPGIEPPDEIKEMHAAYQRIQKTALYSDEYTRLSQRIYDLHAENLYMIGTVGLAPTIFIAKETIGNIPDQYPPWACCSVVLNYYANQLYFK